MRLIRRRCGQVRPSRSVLLLTYVLALAAVGLVAPSSGLGSSAPRCSASNLRLDKVGELGFTSHRSWDLALRNLGPGTCQLKGFPRVQLLDSRARPERTTVLHHDGPPRSVVLRPWQRAFFIFTFTVGGPCTQEVFAQGVRVSSPSGAGRLAYYAGSFNLCGPAPAQVYVFNRGATPVLRNRSLDC
jgi:hypothetical protein